MLKGILLQTCKGIDEEIRTISHPHAVIPNQDYSIGCLIIFINRATESQRITSDAIDCT